MATTCSRDCTECKGLGFVRQRDGRGEQRIPCSLGVEAGEIRRFRLGPRRTPRANATNTSAWTRRLP